MNTYKCYYEEFDDIGSFNNILIIHNHNCKDTEKVEIKNVYVLPIKTTQYNCEGTFQFDSNVDIDTIIKLMKSCLNLETMYLSLKLLKDYVEEEQNEKNEYFIV
jgi:hypothetical protein